MHTLRSICLGFSLAVGAAVGPTFAQGLNVEVANLREDVRILLQRTGELQLRVEQLERQNAELQNRASASNASYATVAQLNDAVADLNKTVKAAVAASKTETLEQVSLQMGKLGKQMNAALDAADKARSPVSPVTAATFTDDYPKDGIKYVVVKGDTLAVIARKTGAKQSDIINANRISDPSRIVVGQALFIPGGK